MGLHWTDEEARPEISNFAMTLDLGSSMFYH